MFYWFTMWNILKYLFHLISGLLYFTVASREAVELVYVRSLVAEWPDRCGSTTHHLRIFNLDSGTVGLQSLAKKAHENENSWLQCNIICMHPLWITVGPNSPVMCGVLVNFCACMGSATRCTRKCATRRTWKSDTRRTGKSTSHRTRKVLVIVCEKCDPPCGQLWKHTEV